MTQTLKIGGATKRSRFAPFEVQAPTFDEMPQPSRDFVVAYGLRQYLADGMAGASDLADAKAGVQARVDNLKSGEFKRAKGEGLGKPDTDEQRAIKLARAFIRDQLKAQEKTADKEVVNAAAQRLLDATDGPAAAIGKKLKAEAKKQVAQEAAAREELASSDTADILADLLGEHEDAAEEEEKES